MKLQSLLKFGFFVIFIIGVSVFVWQSDVSAQGLLEDIRNLHDKNPWLASISFMGVYAVASLIFLPASPFTVSSGVLFGPWLGTFLSVVGATLGASLAFVLARSLGEPFVRSILKHKLQRVYEFNQKLAQNGFFTVLILRLVPIIPFNALNFALGVTRVKFRDYVLATALGIIPGAFVFALGGDSLAQFDIINLGVAIMLFGGLTWLTYKLKQSGIMDRESTETHNVSPVESQSQSQSETTQYDVIVVGAGAAGLNTAVVLNEMGFRVLLVERDTKQIGGDCLNYGCVPSKALLHVAKTVHTAHQASEFGVSVTGDVDMVSVKEHISRVQNEIREHENIDYFRNKGIHIELGEASFADERTIEVNDVRYQAKRIVLATGSRPRVISIPGDEKVTVHTNETIFDLEEVPSHLVVLGGGPIGMEIAQAYRYLGADVSVVNLGERILEAEDPEVSHLMQQRLEEQGVVFYLQHTAKSFASANQVVLESADGKQTELTFDTFLMAIGRDTHPSDSLNLDRAGVTTYEGHIAVNDRLQTSNPRVFVCGDASGGLLFTNITEQQSSLILKNFFTPFKSSWNTDHMAWVTYTDPEVATFGLSEQELQDRNYTYQVVTDSVPAEDRTITDDYPRGIIKMFISRGRILGGTIMAPHAGEIIQELILANTYNISVDKVFQKVYPYPTASRITKHALSPYFLQKLTPRARRMLHWLFRIFA